MLMDWWFKRGKKYVQNTDENDNPVISCVNTNHDNETNELFYKLFVNSVLEEIICDEDLTFKYLKEKHPSFVRKLQSNLIEKLFAHHALFDIYNKLQNEKHIIVNGRFSTTNYNVGILRLMHKDIIQEKIRDGKTKVQILLQPYMEIQALCTITKHTSRTIVLQERGPPKLKPLDEDRFTAQIYPNFEQNFYALNGIRAIAGDEAMLNKLWALEEMENIHDGPRITELPYENYINRMASLAGTSEKTLICSSSNSFVKDITLALRKVIRKHFALGYAARIDTNHNYNPDSLVSRCTVELGKIGNSKLKSFKLVICTLGLAPKLADHGLSNQHFNNIFIHNSQTVSEMEAWMALGKLANVNTKIFVCGRFDGSRIKVDAEILQNDEIGYCISIFERLYCHSSYNVCDGSQNITVIEL